MKATQGTVDGLSTARLSTMYRQAKVLHSAVELGVFDALTDGPASEAQVRERLGLHPRFSRAFLDALTALGLLELADGQYANATVATEYLVEGGGTYLGGAVRTASRRHYQTWGRLTEALQDGLPKAPGRGGPNAFRDLYANLDDARNFLKHMDSINGFVGPALADSVDWSKYSSFTDVGGARGNIAAQIVRRAPHLRGAVFELPEIEPLFHEYMDQLGTADRIDFHGGDFFTDPLPGTDVLIFGHVLHDWSAEERQILLNRAYEALPSGGAVVVYDQMIDEAQPDLYSSLASLNVALMTAHGAEYPIEECRAMAEKAGFVVTSGHRIPTVGNDYVLLAEKP
ncbi:methyltransferase [Actinoplanes sp. NPDC051851]|uniref:methyltransferase n=1 Tax=Actinoplanes sp. NPDC051851 TaxID=3154753 RepID=UPI003436DC94